LWISRSEKRKCEFELTNGVTTDNFDDYSPNAFAPDALLKAKH
jgi:hypothetical protein